MDKITVRKHDKDRVLLTEVLPYETPLFFSNLSFYKNLKTLDKSTRLIKDIFFSVSKNPTVPYQFEISKGDSSSRLISVPHPSHQLKLRDIIFDYSDLITYLCSRSNFSIRKPTGIASYYYEGSLTKKENNTERFNDDDVVQDDYNDEKKDDDMTGYGSSFFSYSGYTLLYKFFDSMEFQSLEKKYSYFFRFDIAKCFDSIYTHSLSWANKGKEFSKENIGKKTFEEIFDSCIRAMNHNETNGIIIGPEFSRIFAEMILQAVDKNVEKKLFSLGYIRGVNYSVKRYVDDYFVFARDREHTDLIYSTFKEELQKYKLFVNESKDVMSTRPFITNLSIAKLEVSECLDSFFKSIKRDKSNIESLKEKVKTPSITNIYRPYTRSKNLINRFKAIVKSNEASYSSFSGLVMTIFRSRLVKIYEELEHIDEIIKHSSTYRNLILLTIDFISFLYCMTPRVRTSYLFAQILVIVNDISLKLPKSEQSEIVKKVKDETAIIIKEMTLSKRPKIEVINLIICLKSQFDSEILILDDLIDFFEIKGGSFQHLDYFELTSILYLLCIDGCNIEIKNSIYKELENRILNSKKPIAEAELVYLLCDLASFPHPNIPHLETAMKMFYEKTYGSSISAANLRESINHLQKKSLFTNWSGKLNIEKLLRRKESQASYHV